MDQDKSKQELIEELAEMRRRVAVLESAEGERQRSEERYRLLTEAVPQMLWRADANRQTIENNIRWYEYTGQSPEEAQGLGWMTALHPDDVAQVTERVREALAAGEPYQAEYRVRRAADGAYRWHLSRALPMKDEDGKITGWFGSVTDVDDQKRAEQERDQNRAILAAAIDCLPFEFFAIGTDGRYMLQNAVMRDHYGDSMGKCPEDHAPDDYTRQLWLDNNRRAFAGERVEGEVEAHLRGETRTCYNIISPIRDDGKVCGILGVNVDITERKLAEEALQKARDELEQRVRERTAELATTNQNLTIFRRFAEASREGFGISDFDGRIVYVNQTLARLFGEEKPEDVIGKNVSLYSPEGYLQRRKDEVVPALLRYGYWHAEHTILPCHGKPTPVMQSTFLIRDEDDNPLYLAAVMSDITERKRAEEEVRDANRRLVATLESITDGLVTFDHQGRYTYVNPAAERYLHKSADELLGKTLTEIWPETDPVARRESERAVRENVPVHFEKFYPEPLNRWYECHVYPSSEGRSVYFRDITERKQAQEAVQRNRELLQAIIDNTPALIYVKDLEGRHTVANQALCEAVASEMQDILGKRSCDFVADPQDAEIHMANDRRVIETGQAIMVEESTLGRIFLSVKFPIKDTQGRVFATGGVSTDITERKKIEDALCQSHDELKAIYDEIVDGIIVVDAEVARPVRANAAYCRMLGYSEDEVYSVTPKRVHPAEVLPSVWEHIETAKQNRVAWIKDLPFLRKDGTLIYADVVTSQIRYNQRPGWISFFHDVTERKQAEEALRASEERFRVAFDEAPLGVVMTVGEGILVRANRTFCRMSGYTEEELIGKPVIDITHPEDREDTQALGTQVLAGANPGITMEKRYLKKHGGFFWGQIAVTAIHDRGGNVIFVLGIIEDITERKRAAEALRKEHRNLKHLLQSSDHERQLIAYEIHDGLAQQLAGAIMQLQAFDHLKDKKPNEAANAYHAGLTMLQQGHYEARRLIAGVRPPILDESGIVEAVAHLIHEEGRTKGPKIEYRSRVDFDRLDPTLENSIYRITQEALANACKYSKSERIWVSLLQREDRVRIEIHDWGVGFDPKAVPKNHFGLEGIRQRARLLGGKCSIKSKAGKGTRIMVELPVVPRDEER